jgi:hypothetical protein
MYWVDIEIKNNENGMKVESKIGSMVEGGDHPRRILKNCKCNKTQKV